MKILKNEELQKLSKIMRSKGFMSRCDKECVVSHLNEIDIRSDCRNSNLNLYFL